MIRSNVYYYCNAFFLDDYGDPYELTPGQEEIVAAVIDPNDKRVAISAYTQYGKSDVIALGIILAMIRRRCRILIIAPGEKQAGIIMGRVIQHLFDNAMVTQLLEYEGSLDRLKEERSKSRITIQGGSEVMILTAEVARTNQGSRTVMGFGANIVIVDEAAYIPNDTWAKIIRMVGGVKNGAGKIIKLGNPWYKMDRVGDVISDKIHHFYRAFNSDRYHRIKVGYEQGIAEGRITQDFIEEVKSEIDPRTFRVLYESLFPEYDIEDPFFLPEFLDRARNTKFDFKDQKVLGIDVAAGGGDFSVVTILAYLDDRIRYIDQFLKDYRDTMLLVGFTREVVNDYRGVEMVSVDAHGLGKGVVDAISEDLQNTDIMVKQYYAGKSATKKDSFDNMKTELAAELSKAMRAGRVDLTNADPELLAQLGMYQRGHGRSQRLKLVDPEGKSPDRADSLLAAWFCVYKRISLYIGSQRSQV